MRQEEYEEIEAIVDPTAPKCLDCGQAIFYENSFIDLDGNRKGRSHLLSKSINGKIFFLRICEACLKLNTSYLQLKNKMRAFNMVNAVSIYAFKIDQESIDFQFKRIGNGMSLAKMIELNGIDEGTKKWNRYRQKQAETNTFEYKRDKFGWTQKQFDEYNRTRSTTLDNLVRRHGKEAGRAKFENYVKRQAYAGCKLEYFVEKYGEELGKQKYHELNKKKARTLESLQAKYGKELGNQKFQEQQISYSKISQELFHEIMKRFPNEKAYFATLNKEFVMALPNGRCAFLDFYLPKYKLCVEFNGDVFHANPSKFKSTEYPNFFDPNKSAQEIWDKDEYRIKSLKESYGIETIVVWQSDYTKKPDQVIQSIINRIHEIELQTRVDC